MTNRPDWNKVMADCGGAHPDDNECVTITRGTARLAASAIRASQEEAAYHNFNAAEVELLAALSPPEPTEEKLAAALYEAKIYGIGATSDANQKVIVEAASALVALRAKPLQDGALIADDRGTK